MRSCVRCWCGGSRHRRTGASGIACRSSASTRPTPRSASPRWPHICPERDVGGAAWRGRQPIRERHEDALNALDVLIDEDAQGTTRLEQPGHAATRSGIAAPQGHDTGRAPPGHRGCDASCAWRTRRTVRGRARAGRSAPSCRYGFRGDEAESAGLEDAGRPRAGWEQKVKNRRPSMVTRQRSRSSRSTATR